MQNIFLYFCWKCIKRHLIWQYLYHMVLLRIAKVVDHDEDELVTMLWYESIIMRARPNVDRIKVTIINLNHTENPFFLKNDR